MMTFKRFKKSNKTQKVKDTAMPLDEVDPLTRYLTGIGTTIGRISLNRKLDSKVIDKFDLKVIENPGRYYTAKIFRLHGNLIDEVLIDRQAGNITSIHFQ
jgi:hypothetical protein